MSVPCSLRWLLCFLLAWLFAACSRRPTTTPSGHVDSIFSTVANDIFAHPQRADSTLVQLQGTLTDSAQWYKAQVYRGTISLLAGDSTRAARFYTTVNAWHRRTGEGRQVLGLLASHQGVNILNHGHLNEARSYLTRAVELLDCPPKGRELISATINLADIYLQLGDLPQSAAFYRKALFLADSTGIDRERTAIYCGLAQTYMELQNFPEAHRYFKLAGRQIATESDQTRFFYYSSLGNCYYFEQRYDEAARTFEQALALARTAGNTMQQLICEGNLAEIALMTDRLSEARERLDRCATLERSANVPSELVQVYLTSLRQDLDIALGRESRYRLSDARVDSLLKDSPRYLMLHYSRLENYAVRDRQWQRAYVCRQRSDRYANELRDLQSRNSVNELALRYRRDTTLLHQRLIVSDLRSSNARQQSYIYLSVLAIAMLLLVALLVIMVTRRRAQQRSKLQLEKINELRMDIVRNRVSPHYIFNVLGTIVPRLQQHPDLATPVDLLIDVLRGNLLTSGRVSVPLVDELTLVRRYVSLHHYSKGNLPRVEWQIDEAVKADNPPIPSMALQIPIENALKHAFPTLTPDSLITVSVQRDGSTLVLRIADNGCGYNPARVPRTGRDTGTGLKLLSRTIGILNQYNKCAAQLSITNAQPPAHGTTIELTLPAGYSFALPGKE